VRLCSTESPAAPILLAEEKANLDKVIIRVKLSNAESDVLDIVVEYNIDSSALIAEISSSR
jgi:hypothetical protein